MSLPSEWDHNAQAQRWGLHIRQTPLAVIEWDMAGRVHSWNPAAELMFGYSAEEAIGQSIIELIVPPEAEVLNQVRLIAAGLTQEGQSSRAEHENRRKDGSLILCRWFNTPLTDEAGHPLGVASMALDVTEIQRSTQALAASEQRFRTVFEKAVDGIVIFSLEGVILDANDSFAKIHGRTRKELLGTEVWNLNSPESNSLVPERMQRMLAGETLKVELNLIHKDGHAFQTEATASLISYAEQPAILSFHRDITERKRAEAALLESEERLRLALEATSDGLFDWHVPTGKTYYSPTYTRMLGYELDEFVTQISSWSNLIHSEDRGRVLAINESCIQGAYDSFEVEFRVWTRSGQTKWIRGRGKAISRDGEGRALRIVGTHQDVTEKRKADDLLRASEERFRQISSSMMDVAFSCVSGPGEGSTIDWIIGATESLFGRPLEEIKAARCWGNFVVEEDLPLFMKYVHGLVVNESGTCELRLRKKDGGLTWVQSYAQCEATSGDPGQRRILGALVDITTRKQAAEDNAKLQAQLQQAQKMESLGTLAGGIAHDMNNVLGAILGLASANLEIQSPGSPAFRAFDTISRATIRGGEMVKSLLTFARQSQAEERELDLNAILREEIRLLERTTLSKVRLELDLEPGLHLVHGDVSALTNAVMNLCINAVDAMPETGTLTLRTRNVDHDWIELLVEDTGVGMSKEVLKRALEPFFTTKATGKGTGLGLSMVYSTVKAHQGQIDIQSELGKGTVVKLRFPACGPAAQATKQDQGPRSESSPRMMKVLLVDDDELIQSSMETILQTLGHTVVTESSGEAALASIEAGFEPDVVILDMNMPGLGGSGTLPRLRALRPAVPVLLSTGRTDQTALDLAEAHPHVTLLPKPFSMIELQKRLEPFRLG